MEEIKITMVDTSSWIEALRSRGRLDVRERVGLLLINGAAAWCDMVAAELWNGVRGNYEKKKLEELERDIVCLPTTQEVWALARNLARKARNAGKTVPSADLIIIACALFHGVKLEHCDSHFDLILGL